jgi:hypothetical protein
VLAVVQDEQHRAVVYVLGDRRRGVLPGDPRDTQAVGDRLRDDGRVADRREFHPAHPARELLAHRVRGG